MAEEEIVEAEASPVPPDHKRKLEDVEPAALERADLPENTEPQVHAEDCGAALQTSEAKRPRLEVNNADGLAGENGFKSEKSDEPWQQEEEAAEEKDGQEQISDGEPPSSENLEVVKAEAVNGRSPGTEQLSIGISELDGKDVKVEKSEAENKEDPAEEENNLPSDEALLDDDGSTITRKMEVPNDKVGVLIGKAGDTIRYLQYNSGAKIQIMRDAEADWDAPTRPVEIIGTLSCISKAEKLIHAVIAEADAGGSPALVARGIGSTQAVGAVDQIEIQVPNEKVGLIIGRGGETIKGLQTRTGARIQLIPQHLPEGDGSKERIVRVTGDKKQIEMAREMIKDVMNQTARASSLSGGFHQQAYRSRGPSGPPQWGPRGHGPQQMPYDYHHQGPYPSQSSHYQQSGYGGYHSQQLPPRGNFGAGWEQRPHSMHGPQSGVYDYYGRQGGVSGPHSMSVPGHGPVPSPAPAMGPPASQSNYGYGHPRGPDYMHPPPYTQGGPQHSYGHGYEEQKYDNHPPVQNPYGAHGAGQQGYPQVGAQSGYTQQQYGKPTSYGMTSQGPPVQTYGPPAASQPGDMPPYQGPTQSYGAHAPPQQQYPYASAPMQQSYPPYGSAPADAYGQQPPASVPAYPQQGAQQVPNYSQPSGQQAPGYVQAASTGGYASYPSQGYPEQPASNNASYGYQGAQDPGYSGAPASAYTAPAGQPTYPQSATAQPSYDQSYPQSSGYAATQGVAPVTYG